MPNHHPAPPYVPPKLELIGTLEELTEGLGDDVGVLAFVARVS